MTRLTLATLLCTLLAALVPVTRIEGSEISEINDPSPLAEAFGAAKGKPRLVLLLSPT